MTDSSASRSSSARASRHGRARVYVGLLALAVAASGIFAARAEAVPALNYFCMPAPSDCSGWYTRDVSVIWSWDNGLAVYDGGDCVPDPDPAVVFSNDTKGTETWCRVRDRFSPATTSHSFVIHVDKTPPGASGVPDRPPDYGAWYNHPVNVSFTGTDETSGIASCSTSTYAGPDGAGVGVAGTCQDVAGNIGSGSLSFNYDATPPPAPIVDALPGDKRVSLEWSTSPDSQAEIVRDPRGEAAPVVVYRGPGGSFTDQGLKNGQRYRYLVSLIDQAGNRAPGTTSAVPTASELLLPAKGERIRLVRLPLLVWKAVRRATYYNVQVFRGRTKVLSAWPRQTQLQLRRSWRFGGKRHRLTPGKYCWYVWPGFGKRSKRDYGKRLGRSCFRVLRASPA